VGAIVSAPLAYQVHPRWSKSQFLGHFLLCQEDLELDLVVLDCLLFWRRRLKKVVNFFSGKVHPRQNPGYAYVCTSWSNQRRLRRRRVRAVKVVSMHAWKIFDGCPGLLYLSSAHVLKGGSIVKF